jgi:hypothetical protein
MVLVDTSVWIDHLRRGNAALAQSLQQGAVRTHPFVVGELAMGSLLQRASVIGALQKLPQVQVANSDEVLAFIDAHGLHGLGIGYVDAHLLAATRLTPGTRLWTLDRRLAAAANRLDLDVAPLH